MSQQKDNTSESADNKEIFVNDKNAESIYVAEKCKRLAGAVYAVTQFFADDEPLRRKLRENALALIQETNDPRRGTVSSILTILDAIRDQLRIARDGGLLSTMNSRILREEISGLKSRLSSDTVSFGLQLSGQYIDAPADELEAPISNRNTSQGNSSSETDAERNESRALTNDDDKPRSAKARRRQQILDLFADTDEITINDVTEVITGFSKKTLQRDLKALVKAGKLEKHGKRRWSSYTKAKD